MPEVASGNHEIHTMLSAKVHKSWVGEVQFIHDVEGDPMILSAGNDNALILSRLQVNDYDGADPSAKLTLAAGLYDIHSSGIFAMDVQHGEILCCSKDGTVTLSTVRNCSLE